MRRTDWLARMWEEIDSARNRPFSWESHNCCVFAAKVVDAMCNTTYADALVVNFWSEETAAAYLASMGGMEAAVTSFLGDPKEGAPVRGDVAMISYRGEDVLGVCVGNQIATAAPRGVAYVPATEAITAWRV